MKNKLVRFFAIIGVGAFLVLALAVVGGIFTWRGRSRLPAKILLEVNLEKPLLEHVPGDPVAQIVLNKATTLRDVVEALDRAGNDERVVGVVARLGAVPMGMATLQELRDAVLAFRKKGKLAIASAETFGEFSAGNGAYYLATAFSEIYLQPSGDVGLTGLLGESPFLRGTLDKLGVQPRMDHRKEFKNAMNLFTEKKFTEAHKEALKKVMDSQFSQLVRGISAARGLSEAGVRALADRGPLTAQEAMDGKLVDGLAYRDEVYAKVRERAGKDAELCFLERYLKRAGRPNASGDTVALIFGTGPVVRGESDYDPLQRESTLGSDSVTAGFRAAIDDKAVKAILFRVNSPGGSYVASDAIWREVVRARKAGKPVVVSMGDVAGSGGYFVAMAADKIVAQPGTITGSIGVLGGKMVMSGLYDKLGLSFDEVHTSQNSTMWTSTSDYTPTGWARLEAWLDRVYEDFTTKVADGRKLPKDKVLQIAKGRIWTGEDAKTLGLVDALGGYDVALQLVREAAKLKPDAKVELRVYPRERSPLEMLGEGAASSEDSRHGAGVGQVALGGVLAPWRALDVLYRALGYGAGAEVLSMEPPRPLDVTTTR
jgi:protease-4